ncbi:Neurotrophin 1 [Amphibalanus amphitrite]|uniref:Neurotrophin 1 n=1 Tax=Amphibalanus amphitrite TaxID=1232801 RepID=A0A6A4WPC1_AMPAM|nr:Neurotrophin 1 [Amphibalanus amphitrite]
MFITQYEVLLSAVLLASQARAASIIFPGGEPEPGPPQPSETSRHSEPPRQQLVFRQTPKCAQNPTGICSTRDTQDYPTELIRLALANANEAALSEITRGDDRVNTTLTLGNRFGGTDAEENSLMEACATVEDFIYPTMARNVEKEWKFVANVDSMTQSIRVEKCQDEGKPCKISETGTICRQKYIYRKLLAMDGNQRLEADNFRIPSTCVCYINGFAFSGGETDGLSGSPLYNSLSGGAPAQGTAQQSIETEDTLSPSDTIGRQKVRFAGEIVVESNPIIVQKKPPKSAGRRN